MRRSAKFHVDSAVRFWAIANIREGGVKRPPPVKRELKLRSIDLYEMTEVGLQNCFLKNLQYFQQLFSLKIFPWNCKFPKKRKIHHFVRRIDTFSFQFDTSQFISSLSY